jgi:voltage-gated potassium channel
MDNVVYLIMRRMRAPLLVLIGTYAVAMAGMVLIPAQDAAGNPVPMSFFHAFYFVSYMSTTIGFGELPNAFTDAQRIWVSFSVFATVAVWLYAIGTLISLLQDTTFQRAITESRFRRRVRRLREPFYLVCGYGQTGTALVRSLTDRHRRAVAIDIDPQRVNLLKLDNLREYVPALCADARQPASLEDAGLRHPLCKGVVALTNVNETNLKIAIAAKLLHPEITVICRADSHEVEANMASFGTDHIYDPFDTFALDMAIAIQSPCLALLSKWLAGYEDQALDAPIFPPAEGHWVLCGYGRFGKAMYRHLSDQGLDLTVIEALPHKTGIPKEGVVHGRGTEAVTLEQAGIGDAVGLVAGTDERRGQPLDHHDRLDAESVPVRRGPSESTPQQGLVRARRRPGRDDAEQHHRRPHPGASGHALAGRAHDAGPYREDDWACELVSRVVALVDDHPPHVWEVTIDEIEAPALCAMDRRGNPVTVEQLSRDPRDREQVLPLIVLLRMDADVRELLPAPEVRIRSGDRLLLCGRADASRSLAWTLRNRNVLDYVLTGNAAPGGLVWRWLARRRPRAASET